MVNSGGAQEMIHLGHESIETYFVAEYLLRRNYSVSLVGHGDSMKGIIADGERMGIEPFVDGRIQLGDAVCCRIGEWGYQTHKVAASLDEHRFRIETAQGDWCGNVKREQIFGRYIGPISGEE